MKKSSRTIAHVVAAALAAGAFVGEAAAQTDPESLKRQIDSLQRQIDDLKRALEHERTAPPAPAAAPAASAGPAMKPGDDVTFQVGGGEIQLYGHVDVSLDYQTNGLSGFINDGHPVTGKNGWVPDISSNLSYFGVRGHRAVTSDLTALFQFETEVAFSATPGASDQAPDGTAQKFSLGSRNSFIGLRSKGLGTVYLGKTDTPYKTSTGRLDPFASTPGDYNAIIGNSGGDNRAEFDSRLAHSAWYQSPRWGGGFNFGLLVSPGQNRSTDTGLYAQGEPDCTGGNSSAGLNGNNGQPTPCEDGSFGNAYSTALTYQNGPLYVAAAYELHKDVNRKGDETVPGTVGVRDEMAYKLGIQYNLPTHTTLNFEVERLRRDAITPDLDERTRTSTWFALTQHMTPMDDLNFGWAHAGHTPGQPDQGIQDRNGVAATPGASANGADLLSIGYKHHFDKRTTWYATYSHLKNEQWGHYSLGAGGHGLPTRNYVGDKFIGGCLDGGNCGPPFGGNTAQAFSLGMTYDY
jgi:predicted porin